MAARCSLSAAAISCSAVRTIWVKIALKVWALLPPKPCAAPTALIGNVAVKTDLAPEPFVGFENHGGRTCARRRGHAARNVCGHGHR